MKRKVVSIFSGIDCLGLGVREKFDVVLAVEKEKQACNTLIANKDKYHPNLEVWNRDITSVTKEEIETFEGVSGIIGGPPCQGFSTAKGKFDPDDERLRYIFDYLDWVEVIKPKFFLFENVKGILQPASIPLFEKFLKKADQIGYDVTYKLIDCHDYGSAQQRKRVFAVGLRKDLNTHFSFPAPVDQKKFVRDILDKDKVGEYVEARPRIKELMPLIPEGGCWRHLKEEKHLIQALGVNYAKREGGMTGKYRRLHRDKPCPTLTTDPVQNNTLLYHPLEDRPLSVTEYKRGQGIPEDYIIKGTVRQQYEYIGNGVPVEAARELAKAISNTLDTLESDNR